MKPFSFSRHPAMCHNLVQQAKSSHCAQATVQIRSNESPKICSNCKKEQPLKQRLKKKLQRFDEKREEWVVGRKKNHNIASIKDESIVMLEKLHASGYKPILLLGKETKKKEYKCEILTPRCKLSTYAQDYLQKIGLFYEYLCEGWNEDSSGHDDQLFTLHPTPSDPLENTSNREEVRNTQVEETKNMLVEQISNQEEQVEQMTIKEEQVEQVTIKEEKVEQMTIKQEQVEQVTIKEEQVEQMSTTEGQVEQMSTMEGQVRRSSRFAKACLENPGEMTLTS
ncbi:hypothetical protein HF521_000833 [Silurus meridionalis]|uniref:Uncharacterized protein n=1 Tax=Silurus meridionalis TaxID=175797 RepID=A0A8T0BX06_SILME|nr:hypothetical protein HF521_000833 [Silurus meridionalis]